MSTRQESYLAGLIGDGVLPSLTPPIHEREAEHHGLRCVYRPVDLHVLGLGADAVGPLLRAGRDLGFNGWWREFGDGRVERETSTGTVVDHVNLAQPWQSFDESVLFLASVLSLDPAPSVDVASPQGLVRSQVMRTSDGCVRVALNVAPPIVEQERDRLRQAQHVAFSCDDLVSFARQARDRGLRFLRIPANYYDDLAARFDLDAELLATLRELDLLYDRDDQGGEFLHFYTATVGSVFFEVVERRGGYDGYGAPNAPVRLATQHARLHGTLREATGPDR